MPRLIISTAGTSVGPTAFLHREAFEPHATFKIRVRERMTRLRDEQGRLDLASASAELNVLAKLGCGNDDSLVMLATDTDDGFACAEMVAEISEREFGAEARVHRVSGLQIKDATVFRKSGVANLFEAINDALRGGDQRNLEPAFNINGGFKSVLPLVALYATLRGVPCHYAYERTPSLITLPPLPISFDWARLGFAADALRALHRVGADGAMDLRAFVALLPNHGHGAPADYRMLIEQAGDLVSLSLAGQLAFDRLGEEVARTKVLFSPKALRILKSDVQPELERDLEKIRDPLERSRPGHSEGYRGKTDLRIWKTEEGSAPRIFYEVLDDVVRVYDIMVDHDAYDRQVQRGPGVWRADQEGKAFVDRA